MAMREKEAAKYIRDNIDIVGDKNFNTLYKNCKEEEASAITQLFLDMGVNPLDYLNYIPIRYAEGLSLTEVVIPNTVRRIEDYAFSDCMELEKVTLPISLRSIGINAFSKCICLEQINYHGTMNQWDKIIKNRNWDRKTPEYIVHCEDGDITNW